MNLDAIKQRLALHLHGPFNQLAYASGGELVAVEANDISWLVAEVERLQQRLVAMSPVQVPPPPDDIYLEEIRRLRAELLKPRTIHIGGSIRGGDAKADGGKGDDVIITGDLVVEVERLRRLLFIVEWADDGYCPFCCGLRHTSDCEWVKAMGGVGAGAGAQSRVADVHLVLRDHEEAGVAVVDAAVRSFAPSGCWRCDACG